MKPLTNGFSLCLSLSVCVCVCVCQLVFAQSLESASTYKSLSTRKALHRVDFILANFAANTVSVKDPRR